MVNPAIPAIVVSRLPIYLRALVRMEAEGLVVTSSQELANRLGISSAQIRKDLSHFGEFGKQGTGYNIEFLRKRLQKILKLEEEWEVALIGAGHLGQAIAHYGGFVARGFRVSCVFDQLPDLVGTVTGDLTVLPMSALESVLQERRIKIAMLAVPTEFAQEVTNRLINAGIISILNYAPVNLVTPEHVRVQYIDPVIHLQRMTYYHL